MWIEDLAKKKAKSSKLSNEKVSLVDKLGFTMVDTFYLHLEFKNKKSAGRLTCLFFAINAVSAVRWMIS